MKISESIKYIGVNDHKIDLFEGQYKVPNGISYNSYLVLDEKVAVFDTVDQEFTEEWLNKKPSEFTPKTKLFARVCFYIGQNKFKFY